MKKFETVGLNVHFAEETGKLTPANSTVYKDEAAVLKAVDKGELTVPEGFAGISIIPVLHIVEAKPKAEPKPKAAAAPKSNAKPVTVPPAPIGEGTNPKG